ncbi:MAG: multidrug efflux SMR transporter [Planctomycetes bacterium]|nr:multidrug efflux SMR transporter [Planctomycetota bacterium]
MQWGLLALGLMTELGATTCLKLSNGFTNLIPSIFTFVFLGISFGILIVILKEWDLSFTYAIWAGVGILIVTLIGIVCFKEPTSALKIGSIVMIATGVVGLNLSKAGQL